MRQFVDVFARYRHYPFQLADAGICRIVQKIASVKSWRRDRRWFLPNAAYINKKIMETDRIALMSKKRKSEASRSSKLIAPKNSTFFFVFEQNDPIAIRSAARWLAWSRDYKAQVLAQPQPWTES